MMAALSAALAVSAWMPMAFAGRAARGELGEWFWAVDVAAALASPGALVALAAGASSLVFRRWRASAAILACALAMALVPMSEPRLGRAPPGSTGVRVLIYNARTGSGAVREKDELIAGADADVVAVLEPPIDVVSAYLRGEVLAGTRTGWKPAGAWSGCPILASRWEVEDHGGERGARLREIRRGLWDHFYRLEIVQTPAGDVAVILMHARSPRRPSRWREGLEQLLLAADLVREVGKVTGLPVVVAGDFNSTPVGVRARAFARRAGLVRAKPAMRWSGTYPAWMPGGTALAIDDVYATPGVRVASWDVVGSAGSDHRGVVVGLELGQ